MRLRSLKILVVLLLISTLGCNVPTFISSAYGNTEDTSNEQSQAAISYVLVTSDPKSSPTVTPFQPIFSTATAIFTPTFTMTNTALPTATSIPATSTPVPSPRPTQANTLQVPSIQNQENIIILGSDIRPGTGIYRTDVMLWVSINPQKGTVSLISFPRDLWVYIPGWGDERINTAQYHGFSVLQQTFKYNFGITPDHYILTNFDGFKTIIDTLGGIDVNAAKNLTDACDLPESIDTMNGTCSVGPGIVHMNGAKALWYVRSRYTSSDLDRTRRTQEVMIATFQKLLSLNAISKAPQLYAQIKGTVDTDMSFTDFLALIPTAMKLTDASKIKRYYIGASQVYNWVTPGGAMVLVPIQSACQEVIQEALNP